MPAKGLGHVKKWTFLLLCFIFVRFTGFANANETPVKNDSLQSPKSIYMSTRGLERDKKEGDEEFRSILNGVLYLPRVVTDALFYSSGWSANLIEETNAIEQVTDFIYLYKHMFGWYPAFRYSSGSSTAIGATLFYNQNPVKASFTGYYGNRDFWKTKGIFTYSLLAGSTLLKFKLSGEFGSRDNYEFYGFGYDPEYDSRNVFRTNNDEEYGRYVQKRSKLQIVVGVRPNPLWQFFWLSYLGQRRIKNPEDEDVNNLESVFDLSYLPGAANGAESVIELAYNEVSLRYDTRRYPEEISPGIRLEGYTGLSNGYGLNKSQYSRAGFDAAFYIPLIKKNRLLVPRIVFDRLYNLKDDIAIPFTEYPRHPSFRGVSSRTMLRSDKILLVPSIEYQWPLTIQVRGHIFLDYLVVSDKWENLTFNNTPYAFGIGIDIHSKHSELGRIQISTGSENVRIMVSLGLSGHQSDRGSWK